MLVNRLENHVLGECDMQSTQVQAALGLLNKTLPNLQAVHNTDGVKEMTHEDWVKSLK